MQTEIERQKRIAANTHIFEENGIKISFNGLRNEYTTDLNDRYRLAVRHISAACKGAAVEVIANTPTKDRGSFTVWTSDGITQTARVLLTKYPNSIAPEIAEGNIFFDSDSSAQAFVRYSGFGTEIGLLALKALDAINTIWKNSNFVRSNVSHIRTAIDDLIETPTVERAQAALFTVKSRVADFKLKVDAESLRQDATWIKQFAWLNNMIDYSDKVDPTKMTLEQLIEVGKHFRKALPK